LFTGKLTEFTREDAEAHVEADEIETEGSPKSGYFGPFVI